MLGHVGVILGTRVQHLLIDWAHIRILLCCLDLPFYLSFSCLPIPKQHLASRAQVLVEPRRGREALTINAFQLALRTYTNNAYVYARRLRSC